MKTIILTLLIILGLSAPLPGDQRPDSRTITHRRSVDWGPTENEDEYWVTIKGFRKDQYPLSGVELEEVFSSPFAGYKSKSATWRLSADKCEVNYELHLLSNFFGDDEKRAIERLSK